MSRDRRSRPGGTADDRRPGRAHGAGSSHPDGLTFAGALLWRGVVYGATDGVLVTPFPILAVFGLLGGVHSHERRLRAGVVALPASVAFNSRWSSPG